MLCSLKGKLAYDRFSVILIREDPKKSNGFEALSCGTCIRGVLLTYLRSLNPALCFCSASDDNSS